MFPIHSEEERKDLETSIKGLEQVLAGFKNVHDLKRGEISESEKFLLDSKIILTLYGYDVFVLFKGLGLAKSKFEAKMMSRYLSMIMYGFIDDVFKMLGSRFETSVASSLTDIDFKNELKPFRERLNVFKNNYQKAFETVRNNVAAHRDENPYRQLEIIDEIKVATFIDAPQFFIPFNQDLDNYFFNLLERVEAQKHLNISFRSSQNKTPLRVVIARLAL
jgi:hypothetical protein